MASTYQGTRSVGVRARAYNPPVTRSRFATIALLAGVSVGIGLSCGGGGDAPTGPSTGGGGSGGGSMTETITVTASGANPRTLTVTPGTRILFVNSDSSIHEMNSDPHPSHEDCPELNQVGHLNPGQRRESGNLVTTGTCGFHDHANPGTLSLHGTITIR